ncbi:MAG: pectate lyase, partial [Patescibacteria group bacterium]
LQATIDWICLAQDKTECGGVSAYYNLTNSKWGTPYRETTGYIIETFINYFHITKNQKYLKRAIEMGEWEMEVQCEDGAFGELKNDGSVGKKIFNTGQIIIGLISLYKETREEKYIDAAEKAGQWLMENQNKDGSWKNFTTQGQRTYHSRVAWPLLQIFELTKNIKYKESAKKNIDWVLKQQQTNYWFDNTSLSVENKPWTHLIAYTISGLIEYYLISDIKDKEIFKSFYNSADILLKIFKKNKYNFLPCSFDKNWESNDKYTCLTGDAQLAIVWMQIFELTKEQKFLEGANKIIEMIKKTQIIETEHIEIKGGIFGSFPMSGEYAPFMLINWAAKFFADALILNKKINI